MMDEDGRGTFYDGDSPTYALYRRQVACFFGAHDSSHQGGPQQPPDSVVHERRKAQQAVGAARVVQKRATTNRKHWRLWQRSCICQKKWHLFQHGTYRGLDWDCAGYGGWKAPRRWAQFTHALRSRLVQDPCILESVSLHNLHEFEHTHYALIKTQAHQLL